MKLSMTLAEQHELLRQKRFPATMHGYAAVGAAVRLLDHWSVGGETPIAVKAWDITQTIAALEAWRRRLEGEAAWHERREARQRERELERELEREQARAKWRA